MKFFPPLRLVSLVYQDVDLLLSHITVALVGLFPVDVALYNDTGSESTLLEIDVEYCPLNEIVPLNLGESFCGFTCSST